MRCCRCEEEISGNEIQWAFEDPYCGSCFDDNFNWCCRCDTIVAREYVHFNDGGDPYCSECYESNCDDDSPKDPAIVDADRYNIIRLCRQSLRGIRLPKQQMIKVNEKDNYLLEIKSLVGYVEKPLYVYGLIDRDEYQMVVSEDMLNEINPVIAGYCRIQVGSGVRRLGISFSLRKNERLKVVQLIQKLTYDIDKKIEQVTDKNPEVLICAV
jgi:hypothetical protein